MVRQDFCPSHYLLARKLADECAGPGFCLFILFKPLSLLPADFSGNSRNTRATSLYHRFSASVEEEKYSSHPEKKSRPATIASVDKISDSGHFECLDV